MEQMERVSLYAAEVARHLPAKMRADIEPEIRSMIQDALEDRSRAEGRPVDDEMVLAELKRLGPPEKMAASYLPPRYLIGPRYLGSYLTTLRIVLSIIAVLGVIALGVSLGWSARLPLDFVRLLGEAGWGLLDSLFRAAAIVTLVFALIEWFDPMKKAAPQDWDPRSLKDTSQQERISPAGPIVEIVITLLAILFFNTYPRWAGFVTTIGGAWLSLPFLSEAFFRYLPWLTSLWTLEIILHIFLLSRGRWDSATRSLSMLVNGLTVALGVWMLLGPGLIQLDWAAFVEAGWTDFTPAMARTASEQLSNGLRVVIGIIIASSLLDLAKHGYKLLAGERVSFERSVS